MSKKISTNPDLNNPAFKVGLAKARCRLMAFQSAINMVNEIQKPFREIQSSILETLPATFSVLDKAAEEIFRKFRKLGAEEKIEAWLDLLSETPEERKSDIQSDLTKLKKRLNSDQKTFTLSEVNEIACHCLSLGVMFCNEMNYEVLSREFNRELNYRERLRLKENAKAKRYEQYISYRKEKLNKRAAAGKVFIFWRKKEPSLKETDSMLREIRRYAEQHNLEF